MSGYQSKKLVARMMPAPKIISRKIMNFKIESTTIVDNSTWYTISCSKEVAKWIRETYSESNDDKWYEHKSTRFPRSLFDIHEKIYTILSLKWQ